MYGPPEKPGSDSGAGSLGLPTRDGATIPAVLHQAGTAAVVATHEFFHARVTNPHTRRAYGRWIGRFLQHLEAAGIALRNVSPGIAGRWIEELPLGPLSKNQALTALRHFTDLLVTRHVVEANPFLSVRRQRVTVVEGRTPEITVGQIQHLLRSIDTSSVRGLRDRAVIGSLTYTGARVGAVARLRLQDLQDSARGRVIRLQEKGGKQREIPVHSNLRDWLDEYVATAGLTDAPKTGPLFRSLEIRDRSRVSAAPFVPQRIRGMLKTRLKHAGLPSTIRPHSFRVFVVTDLLTQDVPLEAVQYLAGHSNPQTTQVYDRRRRAVTRKIVERISA